MALELAGLIAHPERLDKETLYELRQLVAQYPYFQTARLLFLRNLFLLHDPSFGEELRRTALGIPDRRVIFKMVEGNNYEIQPAKNGREGKRAEPGSADRTLSLIDDFLQNSTEQEDAPRRKLTIADATTDYAAFLMQMEDAEAPTAESGRAQRSQMLIDDFIENKTDRIVLQEKPEFKPELPSESEDGDSAPDEDYFTETLAKIYIKQGRYEKAMEIIRKLNLNYPKKNIYFADQMRFLQKLIINNRNKK